MSSRKDKRPQPDTPPAAKINRPERVADVTQLRTATKGKAAVPAPPPPPPKVEETFESSDEEEEEFEEGDFDEDDEEEEEGDFDSDDEDDEEGEASEDSQSYSDDSEAKSAIEVNFDVREMFTRHVDAVSAMIDNTIPDGENLVDRHDFGIALKAGLCTTLITVTQIEEDDASDVSVNTADPMDDEDVYGICSFLPVASMSTKYVACAGFLKVFNRQPDAFVITEGTSPIRLLSGSNSRAVVFVNDHLNVLPPQMIGQVHQGMLDELTALANHDSNVANLQYIVMLARVQRTRSEKPSKAVTAAPGTPFDLQSHSFTRWEDETYYRFRDNRISVPVFKFPRYIEDQAEPDIPRCVVFGLTRAKFTEAVAAVQAAGAKLAKQ